MTDPARILERPGSTAPTILQKIGRPQGPTPPSPGTPAPHGASQTGGLPPGVVVRGGPGGTTAHLEDLAAAAAALDRAAAGLERAANRCSMLAHLVEEASPWSPSTAPAARGSLERLLSRRAGAAARAEQARSTATSLRTTAELYARTDRDVAGSLRSGLVVAGSVIGEGGPLVWAATGVLAAATATQVARGVVVLRLLRHAPGPLGFLLRGFGSASRQRAPGLAGASARLVGGPGLLPPSLGLPDARTTEIALPGLAAFLRAGLPGRSAPSPHPVRAVAGLLANGAAAATALWGTPTNGVVVTQVLHGMPRRTVPPEDTGDLFEQVRTTYPKAHGSAGRTLPGSIALTRLDHEDGTVSWVAFVPGTQEWDPVAGSNPFDLPTDLDAMAGRPDDISEAVVQAMTDAGIAPGEPVALVGHSLGGLAATRLATDPAVQERFTISLVVTAGGPVGDVEGSLPPDALAIHYEDAQDWVGASDGAPNPDDPQRVTVTVNQNQVPWGGGPDAHIPLPAAHGLEGTIEAARALEGTTDPSLRAAQDAVTDHVGGTVRATTSYYQATRVTTDLRDTGGGGGPVPTCVP